MFSRGIPSGYLEKTLGDYMEIIQITKYKASDGGTHNTHTACEKHERILALPCVYLVYSSNSYFGNNDGALFSSEKNAQKCIKHIVPYEDSGRYGIRKIYIDQNLLRYKEEV